MPYCKWSEVSKNAYLSSVDPFLSPSFDLTEKIYIEKTQNSKSVMELSDVQIFQHIFFQ